MPYGLPKDGRPRCDYGLRLKRKSPTGRRGKFDRQNGTDMNNLAHRDFVASDWKSLDKNTLKGSCTLTLPSGLVIKEITYHEQNGKRWIGFPGRPWTRPDGSTAYVNIFKFATDEAKTDFDRRALAAIGELRLGLVE
jgi:hypothetical protein